MTNKEMLSEEEETCKDFENRLNIKIEYCQLDFMGEDFFYLKDKLSAEKLKSYLENTYDLEVEIYQKNKKFVVNSNTKDEE